MHEKGAAMTTPDIELAHMVADPADPDGGHYSPVYNIDRFPVSDVPIRSLRVGFFMRGAGTDPAHVKLLADSASPAALPPILVQRSGLRIIDGMHRIEAAKLRGESSIRARFVDCTDEEAYILAVKSNTLHGLPLTRADRIAGAERILAWHPDWSDRAVGAATELSAKTVAGIRRRLAGGVPQLSKRLGRDGKRRPVVNSEGRRRAADYLTARPDASLREVARAADVSLGTVHDVRARMRQGMDPVAGGGSRSSDEKTAGVSPEDVPAARRPPGDVPSARYTPRTGQQPTWPIVSAKLANDPSLKYTEAGRNFIRWMAAHTLRGGEWEEFIDAIPPHWLRDISLVAERASGEWRDFAEQLRRRQNQAV
jgi:ParB-like chromosome segregation protein Spo0J